MFTRGLGGFEPMKTKSARGRVVGPTAGGAAPTGAGVRQAGMVTPGVKAGAPRPAPVLAKPAAPRGAGSSAASMGGQVASMRNAAQSIAPRQGVAPRQASAPPRPVAPRQAAAAPRPAAAAARPAGSFRAPTVTRTPGVTTTTNYVRGPGGGGGSPAPRPSPSTPFPQLSRDQNRRLASQSMHGGGYETGGGDPRYPMRSRLLSQYKG